VRGRGRRAVEVAQAGCPLIYVTIPAAEVRCGFFASTKSAPASTRGIVGDYVKWRGACPSTARKEAIRVCWPGIQQIFEVVDVTGNALDSRSTFHDDDGACVRASTSAIVRLSDSCTIRTGGRLIWIQSVSDFQVSTAWRRGRRPCVTGQCSSIRHLAPSLPPFPESGRNRHLPLRPRVYTSAQRLGATGLADVAQNPRPAVHSRGRKVADGSQIAERTLGVLPTGCNPTRTMTIDRIISLPTFCHPYFLDLRHATVRLYEYPSERRKVVRWVFCRRRSRSRVRRRGFRWRIPDRARARGDRWVVPTGGLIYDREALPRFFGIGNQKTPRGAPDKLHRSATGARAQIG